MIAPATSKTLNPNKRGENKAGMIPSEDDQTEDRYKRFPILLGRDLALTDCRTVHRRRAGDMSLYVFEAETYNTEGLTEQLSIYTDWLRPIAAATRQLVETHSTTRARPRCLNTSLSNHGRSAGSVVCIPLRRPVAHLRMRRLRRERPSNILSKTATYVVWAAAACGLRRT